MLLCSVPWNYPALMFLELRVLPYPRPYLPMRLPQDLLPPVVRLMTSRIWELLLAPTPSLELEPRLPNRLLLLLGVGLLVTSPMPPKLEQRLGSPLLLVVTEMLFLPQVQPDPLASYPMKTTVVLRPAAEEPPPTLHVQLEVEAVHRPFPMETGNGTQLMLPVPLFVDRTREIV